MAMDISANPPKTQPALGPTADGPQGLNKKFLETFKVLPEERFRTTDSGLRIAVVKEGEGKPLLKDMQVTVQYSGWLESGEKFDTSVGKDKPFSFTLGRGTVIKGWEEGLQGMKPGERRQLIVPAELAYGDRQVGKIPPGSVLIFNVEALSVEEAKSPNPKGNMSITA
ncbi:MAG: FKBP-type peptidyl-prolyl cis-trans isomerase [Deltaproteobacteria bacterium]|nr:FKBP-type peptidyl-prolyl cis-trans isomerase [Deltaproteobacteria bacterium]